MGPRLYLALKLNTTEILTTSPRPIRRKINQATPERRSVRLSLSRRYIPGHYQLLERVDLIDLRSIIMTNLHHASYLLRMQALFRAHLRAVQICRNSP